MDGKRKALLAIGVALVALPLGADTRQRYTITTTSVAPHARAMAMVASAGPRMDDAGTKPLRLRTFTNLNGFAADLTPEEAARLRDTPGVTSVHPVVERRISGLSGAPEQGVASLDRYEKQFTPWGLVAINAPEVWPYTRGEGVNVAMLDTGIDLDHPDLKAAYAGGVNIYDAAALPADDNFHGTHTSGIVAAADNGFGVVGAAPKVRLWAVKAVDSTGTTYDEYIAAGLDWVVSKQRELGGRWVVNMSIGSIAPGAPLEKAAVDRALAAGVVLVASAGNSGQDRLEYPAAYPGVIPVGAVGKNGRRATFSNWGLSLDVVAPGVGVQSTYLKNVHIASDIVIGNDSYDAKALLDSPMGTFTGRIVDCKLGNPEDFPPSVRGNIALIRRGTLAFRDKSRNAKEAGAAFVIISDYPDGKVELWTLNPQGCPDNPKCEPLWKGYVFPVTVGISAAIADEMLKRPEPTATGSHVYASYGPLNGTSMSAPHVAATAALLLSLDPTLAPLDIALALKHTARDTADEGWDYETGYGGIDALAAAKYVAPAKFNLPPVDYRARRRGVRP